MYKILGFAFHSFSRIKQFVSCCYGISFYVLLCTYILQAVYKQHDADNSGHFCSAELREALRSVGYSVSNATFSAIVCRYSDRDGYVRFDDFVECLVKLTTMIGTINYFFFTFSFFLFFFFAFKFKRKILQLRSRNGNVFTTSRPPPPSTFCRAIGRCTPISHSTQIKWRHTYIHSLPTPYFYDTIMVIFCF